MTWVHVRSAIAAVVTAVVMAGPGCSNTTVDEYLEGVAYDAENPNAVLNGGKADGYDEVYTVPTDLPFLFHPEIIISLDQLTVHLFDRETGFSEVYPAGPGVLNADGLSVTPTGHFATGPDTRDHWWYIPRRVTPDLFGGYPFLRLTATNALGQTTYGLHGPIDPELIRGYVSHGCVRMATTDIVRLYYLVNEHASTPVTIQREPERDAAGNVVDLGTEVTLWAPGDEIDYGTSVGDPPPEDHTGTDADGCADDHLESATPVDLTPGSYRLILCSLDETDVYALELSRDTAMTAVLVFNHALSNLDLLLVDPSGAVVAESTSYGDQETVDTTAAAAGRYLLYVWRHGTGQTLPYTLTLSF